MPAETSVLCEGCGYTLDGLPTTGQCPECGLEIAPSLAGGRKLPPWEDAGDHRTAFVRFGATSAAIIFRPKAFYRTLATRRQNQAALRFARVHWALSAILFAGALSIHAWWYERYLLGPRLWGAPWGVIWAVVTPVTYLSLWGTTRLAARLTAWEAAYRGIRLPLPVVLRGLYYHAAHFLPVAALAFATVFANWLLLRWEIERTWSATRYLYVLCLEVVLAAGYLFKTYWTGMKNTMYANR